MNIQQMKAVVAVANNGSFREASKKLFMSQPALSYAIKELEEELGMDLFIRTNKGANITKEGMDFLHSAEKILSQLEKMESKYSNSEKKMAQFSISSQHYDFLNVVVSQLINESIEVKNFRVFESTTQKIIEDVAEYRSEVGIIFLDDLNNVSVTRLLEENGLTFETIANFKTHIILGKHHPLANANELSVESLRAYPQIRFTQEANNYSYFQEDLIDPVEDETVIHTTDRATLTGIIEQTLAYGTGSGFIDRRSFSKVKMIPLKNSPIHRISVFYSKNRDLTPIAKSFIEKLKVFFEKQNENDKYFGYNEEKGE
ncbi:MAG: LysR family transcriptional regulator [Streptococcaceae bacterium]|nr:LysR family transcriptional regulator [Streptococcaceae bacterium]